MYASMNTESLTHEAMRHEPGSLVFELVDAIEGDMTALIHENERLETENQEATDAVLDNCKEMVLRMEQIEDRIQLVLDSVPDHQKAGTYASIRYTLKDTMALLNEAVVYFNHQIDRFAKY